MDTCLLMSSITGSKKHLLQERTLQVETTITTTLSTVFPTTRTINIAPIFTSGIPARTTSSTLFFSTPSLTTIKSIDCEKLVEQNSFLIQIILLLSALVLTVVLGKMQIN